MLVEIMKIGKEERVAVTSLDVAETFENLAVRKNSDCTISCSPFTKIRKGKNNHWKSWIVTAFPS